MGVIVDLIEKTFRTSPKNTPLPAVAFKDRNRVAKSHAALFRNWAEHSEWVRAAVNIRKTQVSQAEWDIIPFDDKQKWDEGLRQEIRDMFDQPSPAVDSFRSFIEPFMEDLLVLDAGVVEKERTFSGQLAYLHNVDAALVKVSSLWDGDPDEARYWWCPDPLTEVPFKNRDMVYVMSNPRTYRVVGLAPLETLKMAVDAEILGSNYNARMVTSAAPDGIMDLGEGARQENVDAFKSYWMAEVAGREAMAFFGGTKNAKFIPFKPGSNRDMQFIEWQNYLVRKIAAVWGLSPQDLGLTFDINRATGDVQQELSEDRGLRPTLDLVQQYLTREVVWDESLGGKKNNLAFRFTRLNLKESMSKANINKLALAGMPWKSVNEARTDDGREALGDPDDESNPFNQLMANTPLGVVLLNDIASAKDVSSPPPPEPTGQSNGEKPKTPAKPTPDGNSKG